MVSCFLLVFYSFLRFLTQAQAKEASWSNETVQDLYINVSEFGDPDSITNMKQGKSCNLFSGTWILDNSYPLYNSSKCPIIDPEVDCQKYGRPDNLYLKYRWKPIGCELPRFNGVDFLSRFRGKKIMFVGDSLSDGQWQSLVCLVHSAVPLAKTQLSREAPFSSFTFLDYEVSISFHRAQFLVDIVSEKIGRVLKLDSVAQNGKYWLDMDVLVFNSGHWWNHRRNQIWDYMEDGNKTYEDMDRLVACEKALTTWANWVDTNIDENKTSVFFRGISPTHYKGKEWNATEKTTCKGETQPVSGSTYTGPPPPQDGVVASVLSEMVKPAYLLDTLTLSQLRKDAHCSIYHLKPDSLDCSHWCIAGLPDTWNVLLYATLI